MYGKIDLSPLRMARLLRKCGFELDCYLRELAMEMQKLQECISECVMGPDSYSQKVTIKIDEKEFVSSLIKKYLNELNLTEQQAYDIIIERAGQSHIEVKIRHTFKQTAKGVAKVGTMTTIGALTMGPVGFVIGGSVGGLWAMTTSEKFEPLTQLISEMKKNELTQFVFIVLKIAAEQTVPIVGNIALDQIFTQALKMLKYKIVKQ